MDYISNGDFPYSRFPETNPTLEITLDELEWEPEDTCYEEVRYSRPSILLPSMHPLPSSKLVKLPFPLTPTHVVDNVNTLLEIVETLQEAGVKVFLLAVPELERALDTSPPDVRTAFVEALAILKEDAPADLLLYALTDPFWDVRAASAQTLGAMGHRTPIAHLIDAFRREQDASVREAIVQALGQQGKRTPKPFLIKVLHNDTNWLVRTAAASALGEIYEDISIQPLINALLRDSDESVRATAATSLGQLLALEAKPALLEALRLNDDDDVLQAVEWALQQLNEESYALVERDAMLWHDKQDSFPKKELSSSDSAIWSVSQDEQVLNAIIQFIQGKKGCIRKKDLIHTIQGQTLLLDCFYQCTELSLHDIVRSFNKAPKMVKPLKAALEGQDAVIRKTARQALETKKQRHWDDVLIVSISLSRCLTEKKHDDVPQRIIMSGMGCRNVREDDSSILDQIIEVLKDSVREPLTCDQPHDFSDIQVWYQPAVQAVS